MSQRRLVKIASGCKTEDQFVAVFNRFCDGESIFIATRTPKPVGESLHFCVTLADGKPLLAGSGSVSESYTDRSGPFSRPGMRITFGKLDGNSAPILGKLTEARDKPAKPKPPVLGAPPIVAAPPESPAPPADKPAGADPQPESDRETKKMLGLPPPILKSLKSPPPIPAPPVAKSPPPVPAAASVDDSWEIDLNVDRALAAATARASERSSESPSESPSETETSEVAERVPGSELVLPANPFGELESESLEHFIECTIYEERAQTSEPVGDNGDGRFAGVISGTLGDDDEPPAAVVDPPPATAPEPPAAAPEPVSPTPAPEPVTPTPPPAPVRAVAPAPPVIARRLTERTVPLVWAAGGAAGALIAGLLFGYLIWSGGDRVAAAPTPSLTASPPEVAAATPPAPEPEDAPDAATAAAPIPDAAPAPAACSIDVSTDPEGSAVTRGDRELGTTPGMFEVPCGEVTITVDHPRYEPLTRTVTATPGEPAALRGRLVRPRFKLTVRTRPSGARVSIDGRRVGVSPVTVTINGFERTKVVASKPGYRSVGRRVYLKRSDGVSLKLRRSRRRR